MEKTLEQPITKLTLVILIGQLKKKSCLGVSLTWLEKKWCKMQNKFQNGHAKCHLDKEKQTNALSGQAVTQESPNPNGTFKPTSVTN